MMLEDISDVCCVSTIKYPASAMMLEDISDVHCVSTIKYPASAMMLGVVASNREKMPPDWFDIGYRLTAAYEDILASRILPCMKKVTKDTDYIFQQGSGPAHTANSVQEWLKTNMSFCRKDFWPPQSPDLSPLNYSIWWHIQNRACEVHHSNTEELKSSVNCTWASMRKGYVHTVFKVFQP